MTTPTREQKCRAIVESCGGHWHEVKTLGRQGVEYPECSCGSRFYWEEALLEHIKDNNPTFANPADLLAVIEQHPKCEEFKDLIGIDDEKHFYIRYDYVKEPDKLLNAAFELVSK